MIAFGIDPDINFFLSFFLTCRATLPSFCAYLHLHLHLIKLVKSKDITPAIICASLTVHRDTETFNGNIFFNLHWICVQFLLMVHHLRQKIQIIILEKKL